MTEGKHAKAKIQQYAEQHGLKYTEARRALRAAAAPAPLLAEVPCDLLHVGGCFGADRAVHHDGRACWAWAIVEQPDYPKPKPDWKLIGSASLTLGRAHRVVQRYPAGNEWHPEQRWFLDLVYAVLLAEQPELEPGWLGLRQAVLDNDLAAVDALCEPLDRAVVEFLDVNPERWWKGAKLRIDAAVERVAPASGPGLDDEAWHLQVDGEQARRRLWERMIAAKAETWRHAFDLAGHDPDGNPEHKHVFWERPVRHLSALLVDRHGGYAPGASVHLAADGSRATVNRVIWGADGPPTGYWISAQHYPLPLQGTRVGPEAIAGPAEPLHHSKWPRLESLGKA